MLIEPIKLKEADMADSKSGNSKRGLASADAETRKRVASAGGSAHHEKRGARGSDK